MTPFPAIDPIPLPAPVWLFKLLHIVTLSLHFVAVWMFLGGITLATFWSFKRINGQHSSAATALAKRLPIVMTYVINFGVPPLLFVQVLYGRAIYTSSVLIGAWWISIVLVLMVCYWLLYRFSDRVEEGRSAWPLGLLALLCGVFISRLLSTNMTLMLRPESWTSLYSSSAYGTSLPHDDPTLNPRWILMLVMSALASGLWMIYLSGSRSLGPQLQQFFRRRGALLCMASTPFICVAALWVFKSQPVAVQNSLNGSMLYQMAAWTGIASLGLCVAAGVMALWKASLAGIVSLITPVLALLFSLSWTVYRDGIRDLTLAAKGLDVWKSPVITNWSVVVVFLVLFIASIGVIGWLVSVMAKAKPFESKVHA